MGLVQAFLVGIQIPLLQLTTGKRQLGKNNGFLLMLVTMKQHKKSADYFRCSIYVNRKYMYAS
jgi:hypothetical protein